MVICTDYILVTATHIRNVAVVPSCTEITFDSRVNAYVGTARVINLTNRKVERLFDYKMELIKKTATRALSFLKLIIKILRNAMYHNPLGREVLLEPNESDISNPVLRINKFNGSGICTT